MTRLAAFGDSYVYGNEVNTAQCWPALMELIDPSVEVLNYGVGGYGTDQAYLRYKAEGAVLHPSVVIIAFAPDGMGRVVNVYRPFLSNREPPLTKPRFVLDQGKLTLLPNPLPDSVAITKLVGNPGSLARLGLHDEWYEPAIYADPIYDLSAAIRLLTAAWIRIRNRYLDPDRMYRDGVLNSQSHAFRIQTVLFRDFAAAVREAGAKPIVVLLPDRDALAAARHTDRRLFAPLTSALVSADIAVIDLTDAFLQAGAGADPARWFMPGGHYSPLGNRLVARLLLRALRARLVS